MESTRPIMSGCTETGKPLISILMAVYEPRMDWLEEQLKSLNAQTYPNLRLYVRDDCSPTTPIEAIRSLVEKNIRSFPWEFRCNEENLGSNGTFQLLTEEAEGDYFAYCDQDDVWLPEKLVVLQEELERTGALLACSDMFIIDADGKQTADSITKVRRHHKFCSGGNLAEGLLISNFVTGCTMLVKSSWAKAAIPFCPYMVHDHYIALCCAAVGELVTVNSPLIRYRIHNKNQTGLMAGVTDKESYGRVRIELMRDRLRWLKEKFPYLNALEPELNNALCWVEARARNWKHRGGKREVWKYRYFSLTPSVFELAAPIMPEWLFQFCLTCGKRNIV